MYQAIPFFAETHHFPALFPDGTYLIQHGPFEFEVWRANVNEHYSIQINASDQSEVDVVYLGR